LATLPPQWRVPLVYVDRGERKSTLVRLANLHGSDELLAKMAAALPPPPPAPQPPQSPKDTDKPAGDDGEPGNEPEAEAIPGKSPDLKKLIPRGDRRADANASEQTSDLPPAVAALFEARRGFANFHPNRLKQQALLDSLRGQFPFWTSPQAAVSPPLANSAAWRIEGKTADDQQTPVTLLVSDDAFTLVVGDRTIEATKRSELYDGITSTNVSGILACLDAWRSLLMRGTEGYGECFYRGRVPLLGERPLRDCLIGISGELEASWLMHAETGTLQAIEVAADRDDDPAEMYIRWGDESSQHPTHLDLRYGTTSVLNIKIDSWQVGPQEETK